MKTIDEITAVVQKYAAQSNIFVTPQGPNDPLMPKPAALSQQDQDTFFHTLLEALAQGGIKAKLPFKALMTCDTWTQVRILTFHWQE